MSSRLMNKFGPPRAFDKLGIFCKGVGKPAKQTFCLRNCSNTANLWGLFKGFTRLFDFNTN
jgi:hypothetical protein